MNYHGAAEHVQQAISLKTMPHVHRVPRVLDCNLSLRTNRIINLLIIIIELDLN